MQHLRLAPDRTTTGLREDQFYNFGLDPKKLPPIMLINDLTIQGEAAVCSLARLCNFRPMMTPDGHHYILDEKNQHATYTMEWFVNQCRMAADNYYLNNRYRVFKDCAVQAVVTSEQPHAWRFFLQNDVMKKAWNPYLISHYEKYRHQIAFFMIPGTIFHWLFVQGGALEKDVLKQLDQQPLPPTTPQLYVYPESPPPKPTLKKDNSKAEVAT